MHVQTVHPNHSTHSSEATATTTPPTLTRAVDAASVHVDAVAPTASNALFQNAHTPTGTRVDAHQ
jgi:hypothetical protein